MVASNTTFQGSGPVGAFAVGEFVLGTPPSPAIPSWWQLPVRDRMHPRARIALMASGAYQIVTVTFPERVDESKWHQPYSLPVWPKKGLRSHLQRAFTADSNPFPVARNYGWFAPMSSPKRFPRGLRADLQQFFTTDWSFVPAPSSLLNGWLNPFGRPIWPKQGLRASLQQTLAYHPRILPNPNVTVTWDSIETGIDVALFAVNVYDGGATPTSLQGAKVSIIELTPTGQQVATGNDPVSIREG